ncbi:hypothetical protein AB0D86_18455 [Streptomyces sp. NPDC048324]|uniref:hypothetical protein n=1 Tax=Streptomyces sp. NPDC048324 TaxID=3157205 RepID=UPI00343E068A
MDRTVTTGALAPQAEEEQTSYGTHTAAPQEDPPIYADLLREWRARGRTVPGVRDPQWMLLTAISPTVTAQFPGPPRAGRWERAAELPARHRTDKLPAR